MRLFNLTEYNNTNCTEYDSLGACVDCNNCAICIYCYKCDGLTGKEYMIENKQYTEDEFFEYAFNNFWKKITANDLNEKAIEVLKERYGIDQSQIGCVKSCYITDNTYALTIDHFKCGEIFSTFSTELQSNVVGLFFYSRKFFLAKEKNVPTLNSQIITSNISFALTDVIKMEHVGYIDGKWENL